MRHRKGSRRGAWRLPGATRRLRSLRARRGPREPQSPAEPGPPAGPTPRTSPWLLLDPRHRRPHQGDGERALEEVGARRWVQRAWVPRGRGRGGGRGGPGAPRWASQTTPALAGCLSPLTSGQGRSGLPSPRLSPKPLVSVPGEAPPSSEESGFPPVFIKRGLNGLSRRQCKACPDLGFHRLSPESGRTVPDHRACRALGHALRSGNGWSAPFPHVCLPCSRVLPPVPKAPGLLALT